MNALLLIGKQICINDTIYTIISPNNQRQECISLYNEKTNLFLRHYASNLIESNRDLNQKVFNDDSSFIPEIDKNKLYLKVSNSGFINRYIYIKDNKYKISPKDSDPQIYKCAFDIIYTNSKDIGRDHRYEELLNAYNMLNQRYTMEICASKLRSISKKIKKRNIVVFIGTGKLGENAQYAFMEMFKKIEDKEVKDIEILYFARNKIEKDYFDTLGMPCEIWSSQSPEHIQYALQAKVAVFSTHTLAGEQSNSFLLSCLEGAYKIQLWHGFLAKMVGCATLTSKKSNQQIINMIEDCAVNVVTTAINTDEIIKKYSICFPGADVICTGDARTDTIFKNTKHEIDHWCKKNTDKIKLLISPTYRETLKSALKYIEDLVHLISKIDTSRIAISVKFHPIFFNRNREDRGNIIKRIEKLGVHVISEREDSYAIMNKFDAMITDYSSIRFDFALTGKPIILFRPDFKEYTSYRTINPIKEFEQLDSVCYDINKYNITDIVEKDEKRSIRLEIMKNMGLHMDGKNSERVCSIILSQF
ncbi:CDP-glycerol glycerophosphotransferase family protein [Desulfovibrio piger]|uniref:CDP-glycerol glycerophosphotransferase family protein n=1 Tax=Desulfovibrio piger TaxID=901 RepID=UPI0039F4F1E3